jgi:hypothetical protein
VTEATVAAIGMLSSDPWEYAAHPIIFSGTCKKEMSEEHAQLIKTVLDGCNKQKYQNKTIHHTICIASDSEAKCGDALAMLMMTSELSADSPTYAQLWPLDFLNLLIGPDDITADKDPKHIIKCQQNTLMCKKGVKVLGFCITPSILLLHLQSNGVPSHHLRSLLNPNDKQDVILAYSLLKEIWALPLPLPHSSPPFTQVRHALNLYGEFARSLVFPYVSVDLNLNEQLIHLSTMAHLAFHLFWHNAAGTGFMPVQSYTDIVLMVKNVFFCVAKTKIDNPTGNFYITSLGTDWLETFFGLVRTAVGTDANVDMLQLGSHASGLTEVAAILTEHPEWDNGPHRLTLPVFSNENKEFTSKADHISLQDWRGDVGVANVNLHTCWILGHKKAANLIPDMEAILSALSSNEHIDMLSPLGRLLVNSYDENDKDDTFALGSLLQGEQSSGSTSSPILPHMHEGDLKDALADEAPQNQMTSEIVVQGQKTSKAKALRHRSSALRPGLARCQTNEHLYTITSPDKHILAWA